MVKNKEIYLEMKNMNKMNVGGRGGDLCDTLGRLLFGCRHELKVTCALILVFIHNRCHGPVGVDADESVTHPVLNLVDAPVDKLNLHEFSVQCAGGGVIALSTKLA